MMKKELALAVIERLKKDYPDVDALASADAADIERIVKPCGLGHNKTRDISACLHGEDKASLRQMLYQ